MCGAKHISWDDMKKKLRDDMKKIYEISILLLQESNDAD